MEIIKILSGYALTTIVFFVIDIIWLGVIAKDIYQKYLGSFLTDQVNWVAAVIFYLLYIVGILVFAVYPGVQKESALVALLLGAFLGVIAYATYDLTNLATLKNWPIQIVFIDIIWGAVLTGIVSISSFYIIRFLNSAL
jgi:uncharacterized membrane protein